jgi:phage terminase small subunit
VTAELKDQDYCIRRETRTGAIIVQNPLIGIQKNYADEMRRFAALCGLTIDSRLKAATVKTEQKDEEIKQKFGNI